MTQKDFLEAFTSVASKYKWEYEKNSIKGVVKRGKDSGLKVNPITAVARSYGYGNFAATKLGTMRASKKLGVTEGLASAVLSPSNRGHAQIIRGKILVSIS